MDLLQRLGLVSTPQQEVSLWERRRWRSATICLRVLPTPIWTTALPAGLPFLCIPPRPVEG
ncbi:hypothetical protein Hanom_Chr03g00202961 [Helianthus anomalus]